MTTSNKIEVFGTLAKEETLFAIKDKIVPGSLVFEAIEPFPGYYHEVPDESMPVYVYLVMAENYTWEDIARATQIIKKENQIDFEAAKAYIKIATDTYGGIRLRHLKNYDQIQLIQEGFAEQGIEMMHARPRNAKDKSIIKLIKAFHLQEIEQGVYFDDSEAFHGYFEIPGKLDWDDFSEITRNVKYNWEKSKFDAALGTIYVESRLRDIVRIYSPKIDETYLLECRKKFLERIK
ncbi:hypothetical protein EYV94_19635 [Puteibacter caeruleilacunae]|nr:hypothetical protein EYV94_19635 [Puteibacter caeruleilacunae]